MSNRFSKVTSALWQCERFLALDCTARLLHIYYITSPHQNSSGCARLPDGYACQDLRWDLETYSGVRERLIEADLITWDPATSEIYVNRWFKHCPPMNSKHAKGTWALISRIESNLVRQKVEGEFERADRDRLERERETRKEGATSPAAPTRDNAHLVERLDAKRRAA